MPDNTQSKRLKIVFIESGETLESLSKKLNTSKSSLDRMMKGEQPVNDKVRIGVVNMGYSAEWLLMGTGVKKKQLDDVKLVTEIKMLRTEFEIMFNVNKKLEIRMQSYEKDLNDLQVQINELKRGV